jgi:hypothetical protein
LELRRDIIFNNDEVIRQDPPISESIPAFIADPSPTLPIAPPHSPIPIPTPIPIPLVDVFTTGAKPCKSILEVCNDAPPPYKEFDSVCRPDPIPVEPNLDSLFQPNSIPIEPKQFTIAHRHLRLHRSPSKLHNILPPAEPFYIISDCQSTIGDLDPLTTIFGDSSHLVAPSHTSKIDFFLAHVMPNSVFQFAPSPAKSCATFVSPTVVPHHTIRGRPPRQRLKIPRFAFIH